jgi:hypothetical protein
VHLQRRSNNLISLVIHLDQITENSSVSISFDFVTKRTRSGPIFS